MKNIKYHNIGTASTSKQIIVERGNIKCFCICTWLCISTGTSKKLRD